MAELAHLDMNDQLPTTTTDIPNGAAILSNINAVSDDNDNVFHTDNNTQGSSPDGDTDAVIDSYTTETELLSLVQQQLEYYFSKDNMSCDKYLLSQMDGDHFVPISILASFNQVKRLTADSDLLIKAINESNLLQIDPTLTKVRAIPEKRCILILREIPKETPKEDIQQLFNGETCPKFISCEFAENDCWYVTFPGEEDAQEAHRYLREEVKHFNGNPIRARIKNMAAQRASSVPKARPQQYPYSSMPLQNLPFYGPQSPVAAWPFFDPRFATQYPNGYPSQPTFTGTSSSGSNIGGRNYSVGSTDRVDNRRDGNNRDIMRRGSAGSKRFENDKRPITSSYPGNRYRRDDDRMRNLPNRLRNKRTEEIVQTMSGSSNIDNNNNIKDEPKKDRNIRQQRFLNRPQPKLDFAPVNFPPLPTTDAAVIPPPPPLPPTVSEEGNPKLADIVKGKQRGNGVNEAAINKSPPATISIPSTDIKTISTSTVTVTTTTTTTVPPLTSKKYSDHPIVSSNNKDRNNNNKNRSIQSNNNNKASAGNGNRSRHKDYKKQTIPTTTTTNTSNTSTKLSPNMTKRPITNTDTDTTDTTVPSTVIINEEDEQDNETLAQSPSTKPEKLSYAQMAQQKPKPSPQKQSKQPPNSPVAAVSEAPLPPSPPPITATIINDDVIT